MACLTRQTRKRVDLVPIATCYFKDMKSLKMAHTTWQKKKNVSYISSSPKIFMIYGSMGINTTSIPLNILHRCIENMKTWNPCIPKSLYGGGHQSFAGGSGNHIKSLQEKRKGREPSICLLIFMKDIESSYRFKRFQ